MPTVRELVQSTHIETSQVKSRRKGPGMSETPTFAAHLHHTYTLAHMKDNWANAEQAGLRMHHVDKSRSI